MKRIILATHNEHKAQEIQQMLAGLPFEVVSLRAINWTEEIPETGTSFVENACQKRDAVAVRYPNEWVLADDSGLCVDALNGAPGIYTARYAGVDASWAQKFEKLWTELRETQTPEESWSAAFHCVLALHQSRGKDQVFEGLCKGKILPEVRGDSGFGYDPIFYSTKLSASLAEVSAEEKNRVSHRAEAIAALRLYLQGLGEIE